MQSDASPAPIEVGRPIVGQAEGVPMTGYPSDADKPSQAEGEDPADTPHVEVQPADGKPSQADG